MIGNKMEWLSKIPMPDPDADQLYREEEASDDSGNDGNDEDSFAVENGLNEDAKARRKSFASFASKTLSLRSPRKGSMDVSASF